MGQRMGKLGGVLLAAAVLLTGCQSPWGQGLNAPQSQALLPEAPMAGGAAETECWPNSRQPAVPSPASSSPRTTVPETTATATTPPPDLVLRCRTLPDGLQAQGEAYDADGSRIQRYGYDNVLTISLERRPRVETGEAAFRTALWRWEAQPREVRLDPDPAASRALGYPAWRAAYVTGEGSAVQVHLDLIIQAPAWTFRLHTAAPPDAQQTYAADMEAWIGGLRLTEEYGGDSAPF